MHGLQKVLKIYGRMKVGDITYVWDYKNNKAVKESEMTKEMFAESEKEKWAEIKQFINKK